MIKIKVKPNSSENSVEEGDVLVVRVKAKAENNKANVEVVKLLSKYFGKKVRIKRGKSSSNKVIEFENDKI